MGLRARDGRLAALYMCRSLAVSLALGVAQSATAAPATLTGQSIEGAMTRSSFTVNLRQLNVIAGTAQLTVEPSSPTVYLNERRTGVISAAVVGNVCLTITNVDYAPGEIPDLIEIELGVSNREGKDDPTRIPLSGRTGPTVNPQDEACLDQGVAENLPPIASAGGDRDERDNDGLPGEEIVMSGTATDPDGDPLTFQWYLKGEAVPGATALNSRIRLDDGPNEVLLRVADTAQHIVDARATITVAAPALTANAGADQSLPDTNGQPGERATLSGSATGTPSSIVRFEWFRGQTSLGIGPTITPTLPDGINDIQLRVTYVTGLVVTDDVRITVTAPPANQPPVANAGPDQSVPDRNGTAGEPVTLDASGSRDPDGSIASYTWAIPNREPETTQQPTFATTLPNGVSQIQLTVTDNAGATATDTVQVTVGVPTPPVANAGPDRSVDDTNQQPRETVTLNGSQSRDPDGTIATYVWMLGGRELGRGVTLDAELLDGANAVTLIVTDNAGLTAQDTVNISVAAPSLPPVANAGENRFVDDVGAPGERVTLDGSASTDPDGTIVSWEWYEGEGRLGEGRTLAVDLGPGEHRILLVVTDNDQQTDSATVEIEVVPPNTFTADAGSPQTVRDHDGRPGELVTLRGAVSETPENLRYLWLLGDTRLGEAATLENVRLPDGQNELLFQAWEDLGEGTGRFASDTVIITVGAPQAPTADAGADRTVQDSNGQPGESVTLSGSGTDPDGTIATYQWSLGEQVLGTGQTLQASLPDGANTVTLRVTDDSGLTATDTVTITVSNTSRAPTVNAGADQSLSDADGLPGEVVTFTGTATDDGTIASYQWFIGDTQLGTGATLQARVPDGVSVVSLVVTDNSGLTASDTVQITVAAPVVPVVNAGLARTIEDTDVQAGEDVQLSGSATGTITQYQWLLGNNVLGTGQTITARLPDGVNLVTLRATNTAGLVGSASVQITVSTGVRTVLANVPGLTPNQRRLAEKLDEACNIVLGPLAPVLETTTPRETTAPRETKARPPTEAEQSDFAQKCRGLLKSKDNVQLANAMGQLLGDDFAVARTQTLLFANTQYASVMDRLIALRGGAKGLSLAGLNIMVDGEMIPLAELQGLAKQLLGGGASSDADGALWNDKWGLWARGNYSFGSKEDDSLSPSFDADQYALLAGLDYRLTETAVIGGALAYGNSSVEFNPSSEGSLDTESWAISLYGSLYAKKNFYFDTILNVASSGYDAERNITYVDGYGLVNTDADGDTDGLTLSGGLSGGYDFLIGGLTISPTLGVFYIDAQIDEFTESGAGGLNLIYDEQQFKSLTGNLGVRMTFAWNLPWGVLLPHFRADFVREFEDDVDVFGIRFASDPNAASTPPILVETENPDSSYWRLAAGFSAQFKHGISGYVEYQRLESFEAISFQDISLGLRFQAAF